MPSPSSEAEPADARKPRSYADAPRLPEGDVLGPSELLGGGTEPIELEIGPGRGGFLFERLAADPTVRIVGLEIRRKWAKIVDQRLADRGYASRARVYAEDARLSLPRLSTASVARVFVHFPDPWWKKRHHKRLVLEPGVIGELSRVLRPGGELFVQTDVEERVEGYERLVAAYPAFVPYAAEPRVAENPFGARSPREKRAIADGLPVFRLHYRRA